MAQDGLSQDESRSSRRPTARAIVDAHHHVWDPTRNYHPWLCDEPPIPFRYGDYSAIRAPYLPADYRADAAPTASSPASTSRPNGTRPIRPARWTTSQRSCAQRWPADRRRRAGLARSRRLPPRCSRAHAARAFVRSVRHKPRANPRAERRFARRHDRRDMARWLRAARAARPALRPADAVVAPGAKPLRLAADFPDTQIILNHTGLPADRSRRRPRRLARRAMTQLAACPNVAVKISGLGQPGAAWTAAANREHRADHHRSLRRRSAACSPATSPSIACAATSRRSSAAFSAIVADFTHGRAATRCSPTTPSASTRSEVDANARKPKLGYVGVGLMGLPMVRHLVSRGYAVTAFDIVPRNGARPRQTPARVPRASPPTRRAAPTSSLLNLPTTEAVEEAVFGDGRRRRGDAAAAARWSTSRPSRSTRAGHSPRGCCDETGCGWVDAPVSGGPPASGTGTLTVMAGGPTEDIDARCARSWPTSRSASRTWARPAAGSSPR